MRPVLGRDLLADDEKPGVHVAMLSYQLWQSAYAGDRDIAGRAITLDAHRYPVAGVMPAGFSFAIVQNPPLVWTTLAEMSVISRGLSTDYPDTNKAYYEAVAQPLLRHLIGGSRDALRVLFAAVGLVLLIACANVAGLLLARASRRGPEIAVFCRDGAAALGGRVVRRFFGCTTNA